ncbi:PH domain-containing protein [Phycisphaerales bacterium AB-hyl4]|uniref:PH domain-containing protein n=1 Tax=Natronomicrosphaera hydrolytica TaxID=3242702 RepID=A0ABV4U1I2_9BACT
MNNSKLKTRNAKLNFAEGAAGQAGQDAAALRAAAMLPTELLQPGEIIILLLKPSPWFILLAPIKTLFMLVLLVIAAGAINNQFGLDIDRRDLILVGVGLVGARLFWSFLEWLSRVYVLTDQRVIRVRGVLRVFVFEAHLREIQHTELLFSLRERPFNLGTLGFATAGTAVSEAYWQMVARPLEVHQRVVETLRRYRR